MFSPYYAYVIPVVDQIPIKPFLDYRTGDIIGKAYNCEKSAHSDGTLIIHGIRPSYKNVVWYLSRPNFIHRIPSPIYSKSWNGVEIEGFRVICMVGDHNSIDRKARSRFDHPPKVSVVYPPPVDPDGPLF